MSPPAIERNVVRAAGLTKRLLATALHGMSQTRPDARRRRQADAQWRAETERRLSALVHGQNQHFVGTVLLDGMFDNANYWYRMSLLRGALGLANGQEIGVTGPHNARRASRTFARLGVGRVVAFDGQASADDRRRAIALARRLTAATKTPEDVLNWHLPYDVPPELVYDGLLKQQRRPSVDPGDPEFLDLVEAALVQIFCAANLIEHHRPALLVLSHSCHIRYGALAHIATKNSIPAVVAFGNYGVPRFFRLDQPGDLIDPMDCPRGADIDGLSAEAATRLATAGRDHLRARRAGITDDIGSQYAFSGDHKQLDRASIAARLGWDRNKPIVAVYAANWFDFPHYMGMTNFRDFADFILATLDAATANTTVNWLFRRHPVDDFYGGPTLSDVLPTALPDHIAICPADWDSNDVMTNVDGIVTYYGTIGVEAAGVRTPVLVADRGWYHDCGFVTWPRDRRSYLAALGQTWWRDVDLSERQRRAEIFAGWFYATPSWQQDLVCGDDSRQSANFPALTRMLDDSQVAIQRELAEIAQWWRAGSRFYHTAKMANADALASGNIANGLR